MTYLSILKNNIQSLELSYAKFPPLSHPSIGDGGVKPSLDVHKTEQRLQFLEKTVKTLKEKCPPDLKSFFSDYFLKLQEDCAALKDISSWQISSLEAVRKDVIDTIQKIKEKCRSLLSDVYSEEGNEQRKILQKPIFLQVLQEVFFLDEYVFIDSFPVLYKVLCSFIETIVDEKSEYGQAMHTAFAEDARKLVANQMLGKLLFIHLLKKNHEEIHSVEIFKSISEKEVITFYNAYKKVSFQDIAQFFVQEQSPIELPYMKEIGLIIHTGYLGLLQKDEFSLLHLLELLLNPHDEAILYASQHLFWRKKNIFAQEAIELIKNKEYRMSSKSMENVITQRDPESFYKLLQFLPISQRREFTQKTICISAMYDTEFEVSLRKYLTADAKETVYNTLVQLYLFQKNAPSFLSVITEACPSLNKEKVLNYVTNQLAEKRLCSSPQDIVKVIKENVPFFNRIVELYKEKGEMDEVIFSMKHLSMKGQGENKAYTSEEVKLRFIEEEMHASACVSLSALNPLSAIEGMKCITSANILLVYFPQLVKNLPQNFLLKSYGIIEKQTTFFQPLLDSLIPALGSLSLQESIQYVSSWAKDKRRVEREEELFKQKINEWKTFSPEFESFHKEKEHGEKYLFFKRLAIEDCKGKLLLAVIDAEDKKESPDFKKIEAACIVLNKFTYLPYKQYYTYKVLQSQIVSINALLHALF